MGIAGNKLIAECSAYDFKVALEKDEPESWLKSVSAFADGEGGSLYFGVNNAHEIVGIENPQATADEISRLMNLHMDPVPLFTLTPEQTESGKIVIELKVNAGTQTPYYVVWKKRRTAYVRHGNETHPANSHQLFNLVLQGSNRSWDSIVTNEQRDKYSFTMLEGEYNARAGAKWEENLLESFGLVTPQGLLTNAGLLFADRCPIKQSRVYCTKWAGLTKSDSINDSEFQGNLIINLKMAKDFIKVNTAVPWFKLPDYRLNLPEYSERAIEEMCVNHLIHRDYTELGSEVAINIYDDRIETTSPGGITRSFNPEALDPSTISSRRRNPVIAEVFSQLRYMEKRGSGLRKIQDATSMLPTYKEDKRPYFKSSYDFFYTIIPNVNYGMSQNDLEIFAVSKDLKDKTYPENKKNTQKTYSEREKPTQEKVGKTAQKNRPEKPPRKTAQKRIGRTAQKIIDTIVENPYITRSELMERLGKADGTIKEHLSNLQASGIIQRVGSARSGYWKVLIRR